VDRLIDLQKERIQRYINDFRRRLARYLRPGIGLRSRVLQAKTGGSVVEFTLGAGLENADLYDVPYPTIAKALSQIDQHAFGGNLEAYAFHGTNTILYPDRMILIKDDTPEEWSDSAADKDVNAILEKSGPGARR
jgi:hypothetical protein